VKGVKALRKIKRKLRKYVGLLWLGTGITAVTGIVLGFLVNPIAFSSYYLLNQTL